MERYAGVKFKQAFQLKREDIPDVIQEIIDTIEGGPPVDVSTVRSMYDLLAKSAPTILDDSLSADSYLNVLHMPSTFPRSERSRRFLESEKNNSAPGSNFKDGLQSNVDSVHTCLSAPTTCRKYCKNTSAFCMLAKTCLGLWSYLIP